MKIERRGPKPVEKIGKPKPGFEQMPLMSYLAAEALDRSETPAELSQHLGIGYVYMTQLLSGKKDTSKLGREILVAAAKYLKVPVVQAYLWAGALRPADFFYERDDVLLSGDTYDKLSRHQNWGGFMPSKKEWDSAPADLKQFAIMLFEELTGADVIGSNRKAAIPPGAPGLTNEKS